MALEGQTIGRAKTVLVFGSAGPRKGVISAIVARRVDLPGKQRLHFGGTVKFSRSVMSHIRQTVLPIIDNVVSGLGLEQKDFEISAVNLGAASSLDVGINISGFSADTSVFLAMLSEGLQMPLRDDSVSTGHIASCEGDISAVNAIPEKLQCAGADNSIRLFVHPELEEDDSLRVLAPVQRDHATDAIVGAKGLVSCKKSKNIYELLRRVFSEESIVLGSLSTGFYGTQITSNGDDGPVQEAVFFLGHNNEARFWSTLRWYFSTGDCCKAKELLQAYAHFFICQQLYPQAVGVRLFELICSLPPAVRRLKMDFPILDTGLCIRLSQFAQQTDYSDILMLFDAAHGKNIRHETEIRTVSQEPMREISDSDCIAFDTVTSCINEQSLAQEIGIPLDSARSSFILDSSTVQTYDQFLDILQAFYIHLQHHIGSGINQALDLDRARAEAIALLSRAFEDKGGDRAAFLMAKEGTQGGMRSVLDFITEEHKAQLHANHIQRIFKDAVNEMDWNEQVSFMRGAMKRLGPLLPSELKEMPPERLAGSFEKIVRVYVRSFDKVNQLIRTM